MKTRIYRLTNLETGEVLGDMRSDDVRAFLKYDGKKTLCRIAGQVDNVINGWQVDFDDQYNGNGITPFTRSMYDDWIETCKKIRGGKR